MRADLLGGLGDRVPGGHVSVGADVGAADDTQPLTLIHPISWRSPSRSPRKPLLTASTV